MTHADIRPPAHPFPDLHGHGLRLRPWDADSDVDLDAWFRGRTDPEFRRWNTPLKITTDLDSARESLRDSARKTAEGTAASYCVTDAATGTPLGQVGVNVIDRVMSCARVGYWVLPEARGRRVATHALALTARWALTELGLHRLELGHAVGHDASCHVAERCGFRHEGTLRGAMWEAERYDVYRDVHLHARLATDPDVSPQATRHVNP
ncbi:MULTISPECIES: GNAT family N-acetyltransferase [unclassified Streptomyces]|uniref:GNAT family N-acetyltransferase n=1 Tax=unclassified Streptomyces TaxID=2593676 RepID=UPI002365349B|nr:MULTISPECIES: GNAT family N-acetyltransferase [unclassified Streptomyces]MDF3147644.1 GNAT family N-acetyltransferase [Streptomyces sp. T21Q-yed]WDF39034.1 GNAT family N-acetyltransferase [Streptomyces sp. T12]